MGNYRDVKMRGDEAREKLEGELRKRGIEYDYNGDREYDYIIQGRKIELKSAKIAIKRKERGEKIVRPGRYRFTKRQIEKLTDNTIVCYTARQNEEVIIVGCETIKELKRRKGKIPKTQSIIEVAGRRLKTLSEILQ